MVTPDRHWLLTWTTYGTRLPGAACGFVGNVREADGTQVRHNIPGTPLDADIPALEKYVRDHMTGPPVELDRAQAEAIVAQYLETARVRAWKPEAASVMYNHTHLVVGVPGDPDPTAMRDLFKAWATRALKKLGPVPPNGGWWTAGGSKRKLKDVPTAVVYVVKKQPDPRAVWYAPEWQPTLDAWERAQSVGEGESSGAGEPSGVSRRV
jgi:hypothetical protein